MRQCPRCGTKYPNDAERCCARDRRCRAATVEVVEPLPQEAKPDPVPWVEEDLREDLKSQADQIHDILELMGPLTYEQLGKGLDPPVKPKRASNLVSQMIRDGVELVREGSPRKVSIAADPIDTKAADA